MEILLYLLLSPVFAETAKKPQPPRQIIYREKPSLKSFGEQILRGDEITQLFKSEQRDLAWQKKANELIRANRLVLENWQKANLSGEGFRRGEIDDEKVLNQVLQAVQLSILKIRRERQNNNFLAVKEELNFWFTFAAALPFDEATLVSLRLSNLIRSLLLDEIEAIEKQATPLLAADELWLHWSKSLKLPWPVDRVVLSESRRFLRDARLMKITEKLALSLQKNTYQTVAAAMNNIGGGNSPELEFLKKMWREEDITAMKTEVTRLSSFRVRLAAANYERKLSKKPTSIDELVAQHLLDSVPINYLTGKPFDLTQTALH
jgi:hypothetical protein